MKEDESSDTTGRRYNREYIHDNVSNATTMSQNTQKSS